MDQQLKDFITWEEERLQVFYNERDKKTLVMQRMCKLAEETGELSSEVLKSINIQRKEKLIDNNVEKLADECADVIITTLLLAEVMGIDVGKAINEGIEKRKSRNY
ncbi:MAG: MazG nucleotide pyrophosphohydrolase domain-containing protein, partial [Candidatus Buchananbacteria bacterium]